MLVVALAACVGPEPEKAGADSTDVPCAPMTWYADLDGDGWGGSMETGCEAPAGAVDRGDDCDDGNAALSPDATETCDGLDNDCDGLVDEGFSLVHACPDDDGDGSGSAVGEVPVCEVPAGWLQSCDDCDDGNADVSPTGIEACNGLDDDCDGLVDDDDTAIIGTTEWATDVDGDGYGDAMDTTRACEAPAGHVADQTDCDDTEASVNPGAAEVCLDLVDQDCDGLGDDYTGACDPDAIQDTNEELCDPSIAPVDVALCASGVAAVGALGTAFATVQAAIDAASAGDVLSVCPGTWTESLVVATSPLSLVGYGAGISVLEGAGSAVIDMGTGGTLTLADLSVQGGDASEGGGVSGTDAELCVARVQFAANIAADGGAVGLLGTGVLEVEDSVFSANEARYAGGAVYVGTYAITIEDTEFSANYSRYEAGAVGIDSTSEGTLRRVVFDYNGAEYEAGALTYAGRGPALELRLEGVTFTGNEAGYEGGALSMGAWDYPTVTAVGCVFEDNWAGYEGGAVSLGSWGGDSFGALLSEFRGNSSPSGGAIELGGWGAPVLLIVASTLEDNTAAVSGGAIHAGGRATFTATIAESVLARNYAHSCGGFSPDGGGILTSTNTDWSAGADDNRPDDVCGYEYGAGASFTCSGSSCW